MRPLLDSLHLDLRDALRTLRRSPGFAAITIAIDPLAFSAAIALLVLVAAAGCIIPARRAARVDPLVALRAE